MARLTSCLADCPNLRSLIIARALNTRILSLDALSLPIVISL